MPHNIEMYVNIMKLSVIFIFQLKNQCNQYTATLSIIFEWVEFYF